MSKKKGLSLDDKRRVILSIYHDQKVPFNLKEIENIASRMGVVQQTIKDVNQSLIDDFLVCSDKIGSANFFWSFPSKAFEDLNQQKINLSNAVSNANAVCDNLMVERNALQHTRSDSERPQKIRRLEEILAEEKTIDEKLSSLKSSDPEEMKRIVKQTEVNKASANRWTENVWVVKKFLTKKKGMASKEADKLLKIDSNFDYIS